MAYDPFDPTNQNAVEPYISAGVDAVRTGTTNAIKALNNAGTRFNQQSQAQRPDYRMIAPSRQGPIMPGFGEDLSRNAGELYQGAVNMTSDGMTAAAPAVRSAIDTVGPAIRRGTQAVADSSTGAFPYTRDAALQSAQRIEGYGDNYGGIGRFVGGVESIPRLVWGGVRDVADSVDYLFTQGNTGGGSRRTLGAALGPGFFAEGGTQQPSGGSPRGPAASNGNTGGNTGNRGNTGGNTGGRNSFVTTPGGTDIRLVPDAQRAQRALDGTGAGVGRIYEPVTGLMYSTENGNGPGELGNVNPKTGKTYANEQGALANAIRQRRIDDDARRLDRGRDRVQAMADAAQQGGGFLDEVNQRRLDLIDQIQRGSGAGVGGVVQGNRNLQALRGLDEIAGNQTQLDLANIYQSGRPDADEALAIRQGELDLARTQAQQRNAREDALALVQTGKFLRAGREEQVSLFNTLLEAAQEAQKNGDPEGLGTYMSALSPLGDDLGGPFANVVDNFLGISQQDDGAKPMAMGGLVPEAYAMGGLISDEPYGAMEMYADGGMITPQANVPPPAVMQQYQAYANGARQMGLTAIPFDKFAALQGSSQETIPSFSDGGMVDDDDASGKMVVDTDPNAPTDSIPAMIDGQRPAKLDSGEFVIPKDVVMFYGTDKLQKMIDKVRNPEGGKANGAGQPDTALGFGFGAAV